MPKTNIRLELASEKPFPVGRPVEMTSGKPVNVYLDASSRARAALLGSGNVSEGIRIALNNKAE